MSDLDAVIHSAARLRITATLAALDVGESISFPRLQELLEMTAGNLTTHLRRLEDANYVSVEKTHRGRIPATYVALTPRGRIAFDEYRVTLRSLLGEAG